MKRFLTILFLAVAACAAQAADTPGGEADVDSAAAAPAVAAPVTIHRIKLQIDGLLLSWDDAKSPPAKTAGSAQDPSVLTGLLSWYGLEPGTAWEAGELEARLASVRRLLDDSRLFYEVQAFVIPPQKDPARRTLFVAVTSGFSMRFGGGGAWGMFGDDNADGRWLGFRFFAGYNLAGASLGQGMAGISPWHWNASLLYSNNGLDAPEAASFRHDGRLAGIAGISFRPFRAEIGAGAAVHGTGDGQVFGEITATPGIGLDARWSSGDWTLAGSAWLRGELAMLLPEGQLADRWTARLAGKAGWSGLLLAVQASAGVVPGITADRLRFDLGADPDQGVRAAWPDDALQTNQYLLLNSELRWRPVTFPLGFIAAASVEPFLFFDLGAAGSIAAASAWAAPLYAAGGGIRFLLGVPVFTDFTFGAGCAPPENAGGDWKWKFVFSVTPGF
jgi:hypothetical protein